MPEPTPATRTGAKPRSSGTTERSGRIRIGISGWRYAGWRGEFYPDSLPQRSEMEYACSRFSSVEINGTFYSLQRRAYFERWRDATSDDFVFAIKGSRFITHMLQLNEPRQALANFFGQGVLALGPKLGPILWQFSQRFKFREEKLRPFLETLPRTHAEAAALGAEHDHRVKDPEPNALTKGPIRHAIEIRHPSFLVPAFVQLLRDHEVALVVSHNPGLYPVVEEMTTDFAYLRLHGAERMYYGSYSDEELDHWADRIRAWAAGREPEDADRITPTASGEPTPAARDVYLYFDNDEKTKAPFDARRLMERLGLADGYPSPGTEDRMPD